MTHVRRILRNFTAFLMSIILTALPYAGVTLPTLETKADGCLLNVSMLADTQLEVYADRVLFRPRNFLTGHWFVNSEYAFALV